MLAVQIDDMTCDHCAGAITRAIRGVDENATVEFDLGQHLVKVATHSATEDQVVNAITRAGYTPVIVERDAVVTEPARPSPARGCCCA